MSHTQHKAGIPAKPLRDSARALSEKLATNRCVAGHAGETSGYELENIVKNTIDPLLREDIGQVEIKFSKDFNPQYEGGQILNLGDNTASGFGTHWTATFRATGALNKTLRDGVYFDSYGMYPPVNVELAGFDYTPLHLQSYELKENFCGQWCVLFLKYCYEDNLAGFYSKFNNLHRGWGV